MREYETGFIVQPEISEDGTQTILAKLDELLAKHEGSERLMCEDIGKRKLAYEIQNFHKGHYYYLHYLSDGQVVPDLERTLRLDESILRFMTVQRSDAVADVDARKATAAEAEAEQAKRAVERAEREAEEAKARAESERIAAEQAAEQAAAAAAAAAAAPEPSAEGEAPAEAAPEAAAPEAAAAAPAAAPAETPAPAAPAAEGEES